KPLLDTIKQLCLKINLLNTDSTSPEDLAAILTAKELNGNLTPVYFGCETTQVRYIIDKLRPHFTQFTLRSIEDSRLFHSKTGTVLTAQNLSASKIENPKDLAEIDKAFTHLQ